ncbi:MAG: hypothetical protein ACOC8B_03450 [Gemmatimonadota bacterium]
MKIRAVEPNNRRKAFELEADGRRLSFPYARLRTRPGPDNRIAEVYADPELGREAFTYVLENGEEDSVHLDAVLEYNEDPGYLKDLLLYELTVEARRRVAETDLSKREIIRRLGTSASQFYRLLDPTYYGKSIGQLVALLHIVGYEVDLVVRPRRGRRSA